MLINVLRDEKPTHVAVAFDVSRKTFRSELFAEYKANRSASPDDVQGSGRAGQGGARRRCASRAVEAEGFEADDVIATLDQAGRARGVRRADLHR